MSASSSRVNLSRFPCGCSRTAIGNFRAHHCRMREGLRRDKVRTAVVTSTPNTSPTGKNSGRERNTMGLRERKRLERHRHILMAAAQIFKERGYDDARIEEI